LLLLLLLLVVPLIFSAGVATALVVVVPNLILPLARFLPEIVLFSSPFATHKTKEFTVNIG